MSTDLFYRESPILEQFTDITVADNFVPVPEDWYVLVTDIAGSTRAIKQGRYKEVNFLGACAIVALLNIAGDLEIPFVFGGDGASILVPGFLLPQAQQALLANRELADREFNLELRVGVVPVSVVTADYELNIARLRISENYTQAVFRGGGITYAADLVKNAATAALYRLEASNLAPDADFSGLECRWQDIPSRYGEIVTLMVMATAPSASQRDRIYREVIDQIEDIFGDEATINPIAPKTLNLSFNPQMLGMEAKVRASQEGWWGRWLYLAAIWLGNVLGLVLMAFDIKTPEVDWGKYKTIVAEASDYRKFDDLLRMVISGRPNQSQRLSRYLEKKYQEGRLVYGIHISDSALMTCLVFERGGRQVHFVDGGDGGYALAAEAMKQRMKA